MGRLLVICVQNEEVQGMLDLLRFFSLLTWPLIFISKPQLPLSVVQTGIHPFRLQGRGGGRPGTRAKLGSDTQAGLNP